MAELSPAARAVHDAVLALYQEGAARDHAWPLERPMVTAVLRTLANHQRVTGVCNGPLDWWDPNDRTRQELQNLAEELESADA